MRLKLVHTPGSADSASRLDDQSVDLAVVRMDIATPAAGHAMLILPLCLRMKNWRISTPASMTRISTTQLFLAA